MQQDDERKRPQEQPEKTPDTPTDEPKPVPVQGPYVVRSRVQDGAQ